MADLITTPCLIEGLDEDVYHADPVAAGSLSYTGMKELLKSPAHFRHYMDQPRVEKKVFDAGHIVHALVLGTPLNVVEIPESVLASNGAATTKAAKEFVAAARLDGLIPVKAHELEPLRATAPNADHEWVARGQLQGSLPELIATRCDGCGHDTVYEIDHDQAWDLDETDYGPNGSWEVTT